MRNTLLFIIAVVIIISAILLSKIYSIKEINKKINDFNIKYEEFLNREVSGRELATVINKAIDDNSKMHLTKNDEKYININIKIIDLDNELIIEMEKFYDGGIAKFVELYGDILFNCNEIKYSEDGQVNLLLFEQISK